jgi:hypothetical protein
MEGGLDWRESIEELFGSDQFSLQRQVLETHPGRVSLSLYLEIR